MSIEYVDYFGKDEVEPTIDSIVEDVEETVAEEHPTMMGKIYNTSKVYMRKAPNKESSHVDILEKDEEVMIDGTEEDALGNVWYHLITASGNEGYTMSEFVKIVE